LPFRKKTGAPSLEDIVKIGAGEPRLFQIDNNVAVLIILSESDEANPIADTELQNVTAVIEGLVAVRCPLAFTCANCLFEFQAVSTRETDPSVHSLCQ